MPSSECEGKAKLVEYPVVIGGDYRYHMIVEPAAAPPSALSEFARNAAWLRDEGNRAAYRGHWVALLDGNVLANAPERANLQRCLDPLNGDTVRRLLVTRVEP